MTSTLSVAEGPHIAVVQPSHISGEGVQECHQDVREQTGGDKPWDDVKPGEREQAGNFHRGIFILAGFAEPLYSVTCLKTLKLNSK